MSIVKFVSLLLEPAEREAVLGDLAESREASPRALLGLAGLIARRYVAPWRGWRPWLAPVGLLAPLAVFSGERSFQWLGLQWMTLLHHGVRYETGLTVSDDVVRSVAAAMLIASWSAIAGFALGALARRTVWLHPAFLFILWFFSRAPFPWTLLVLAGFIWGAYRGANRAMPSLRGAAVFAIAVAALTVMEQVEDDRARLAFTAWASGKALDGTLLWTPRVLPFAAILWQFAFIRAAAKPF